MPLAQDRGEIERSPVNVLWMTSGLGCDGDSVALTAATNPSLEDLLRGCFPGMPPVILYNPVLAYETGEEFMRAWFEAAAGQARPVHPRARGLGAQRGDQRRGPLGRRSASTADTGQPISTYTWIDRLAPRAAAVLALGTCAAYGGIPAMRNNPTGAMGLRDYLGRDWVSRLGLPIVNLPGCPVQPDNITETLLCLVLHLAGWGRRSSSTSRGRPRRIFGRTVHESCDRAGLAEHGQFADAPRRRPLPGQARLQGPGGQVQRPDPRLGQRRRRLPERRRHLHGLHDARLPRQVHAVHGGRRRERGCTATRRIRLRARAQVPARAADPAHVRRRAGMEAPRVRADHGLLASLVNPRRRAGGVDISNRKARGP